MRVISASSWIPAGRPGSPWRSTWVPPASPTTGAWLEAKERGKQIPSAVDLHKDWNKWKRENAPWWVEVSKCAPQEAFRDLERAVRNWREGRANFPRVKRKADNKAR